MLESNLIVESVIDLDSAKKNLCCLAFTTCCCKRAHTFYHAVGLA